MPSTGSRRHFIGALGVGGGVLAGERAGAAGGRPAPGAESYDVTRFGAVGNGRTPNAAALQKAVDACGAAGGGTVVVPPGRYLTGAVSLRSHVHLHLSAGATLVASPRFDEYPPLRGRYEGIERTVHASLLTGVDLENVAITGPGTIDGQGEPWWRADEATRKLRVDAKLPREADNPPGAPLRWPRAGVITLLRCRNVSVGGLTISDGAGCNVHLVYCTDVVVDGVTTGQSRPAHGTDADAILVDSSKRVRIANCALSAGGDCVGIKSGYNEDGRRVGLPSEEVLVTNCQMFGGACAVGIGSETSGGLANILITNCVIRDCTRGVHVRSPRGRGAAVEKLRVSNVVFDGIEEMAVKVSHYYDSVKMEGHDLHGSPASRQNLEIARSRKAPIDAGTPSFRDFSFSGLTLGRVREVAVVEGLPERFIRGLRFDDVTVAHARGGITCAMVADVSISNFSAGSLDGPAVDARDVERLEVHQLRCPRPSGEAPAVWLDNVAGAFLHGCNVAAGGHPFEWLRQEQCRGVTLYGNNVPGPIPAGPAASR
jgi:hypothetical protein